MAILPARKSSLKRKHSSNSKPLSRKKQRKEVNSFNDLPWRTVSRPNGTGFEGDDGVLELEEVDGVEVVYEETENGRIAKLKVIAEEDDALSLEGEDEKDDDGSSEVDEAEAPAANELVEEESEDDDFDVKTLLPNWSPFPLHPHLLSAVHKQNFTTPTPIQSAALPPALKGKDVIGVAQTGSGKTLAYGLPIIHYLLSHQPTSKAEKKQKRRIKALILAPTRELALQVASHLKACIDDAPNNGEGSKDASASNAKPKGPPRVSIATIVGGMAAQKQRRLIDRGVDIVVATPGRLWDLLEEDDEFGAQIKSLKFLVLDEADRMIETGHFAELDNIVRLTSRAFQQDDTDPNFSQFTGASKVDIGDSGVQGQEGEQENQSHLATEKTEEQMQTFVFSATLSRDLQQNLKRRKRVKQSSGKRKGNGRPETTLDELLLKLDFRDPEPEVIDLSPEGGVVSTLKESQIECLSADKDVYLYYFLLRYPGRSLVFLSSIDGIRRLLPLMEQLQLKAYPLHSQLQQRQRLKNLDRFKSTPNAILLATDIAARGLDIPAVDHVIHYQIPRSADVYIHRNGRTARASREGFSLLMTGPDERRVVKALLGSLDRGANDIPDMPIELDLLDKLKARVQLAKKIDSAQHKVKKEKHEKNWLREAAEAMEIELDSDLDDKIDDDDNDEKPSSKSGTKHAREVQAMKAELRHLLAQPVVARGVMKKYITSGARSVVSELLDNANTALGADGTTSQGMLGFKRSDARSDLLSDGGRKSKKAQTAKKAPEPSKAEENEEEWTGFGSDS